MRLAFLSRTVGAILLIAHSQAETDNQRSLLSTGVELVDPSVPLITDPPALPVLATEVEKRQYGEDFVAYSAYSGNWEWVTCHENSIYVQHSTWGMCCNSADSTCNYATACLPGGRVLYNQGEANCGGGNICDAITIVSATNDLDSAATMILCYDATASITNTWYRNSYPLTTTASTVTETASTVTETASTVTETVTQTAEPDDGVGLRVPRIMHILGASFVAFLGISC
ncbi:uncharacterized protein BJX67DRAFT_352951 [Aspergillus lucknowensis]|uniref:Uncharacterized protein n=1 Tax=Aspergillus lucknowensis TaxID=176173 RepID=A0ABR4LS68_9EURO